MEAPSVLGLRPTGVELLPRALLDAGLADAVAARQAGVVPPPAWSGTRDGRTGMLNQDAIARYTRDLADAVGRTLAAGEFPIVLGGDCSILLGNLLALRRLGRHGLLFIDGHSDFYQPAANINGEAASSDLALATGRGPEVLTTYDGVHPLVEDEAVVIVGHRDAAEADRYGSQPLPPAMRAYDLRSVRRTGAAAVARAAVDRLARPGLRGFWIHFDVDALDDAIMPAVDYRQPDGLSWQEARDILGAALASRHAVGLDVTIFNPRLDEDGSTARALADLLITVLRGAL